MAIAKPRVITGGILGIVALVLYTITLAPDILSHDVADWQGAAATGGIAHAPGSPAYLLLGWLFTLFPFGSIPERVNFLSVIIGVVGVVSLFVFVLLLFDRLLPAVISASTLMVSAQWWSYASVAQPYNAIVAIIVVLLILLLLWQRHGDRRLIWCGALLFGFGLAYHPTLVYFLPVLLAGVFIFGPWRDLINAKALFLTVAFFALGLGFYLYLPIRSAAEPAIIYQKLDSISGFISYVTASEARSTGHGAFSMPEWDELWEAIEIVVWKGYLPSYSFLVFAPAIIMFHPAVWSALRKLRRWLLYLLVGIVAHMVIIFAFSSQFSQYYMPILLYFSIWAGFSIYLFLAAADALGIEKYGYIPAYAAGIIYLVVLGLGVTQSWSFVNHAEDFGYRSHIDDVMDVAAQDGVVMANWDAFTGLMYAQKVEGRRPDLMILSVPLEGWRQQLPDIYRQLPPQILISRTLPFNDDEGLRAVTTPVLVSLKGRTYQDREHGEPYPSEIQLFFVEEDYLEELVR